MANNVDESRHDLNSRFQRLVLGKEIDHTEYLTFIASLASGPAGVTAYLDYLVTTVIHETGVAIARDTLFGLLNRSIESTIVGGKTVYAGIATYNHWTEERYPEINLGRVTWGVIKVPRPSTFQFYVGIEPQAPSDINELPTRLEIIRRVYVFLIGSEVPAEWLAAYDPYLKQHGIDTLRWQIVFDHGVGLIERLYAELVAQPLADDWRIKYREHLHDNGYCDLKQRIISDHSDLVVINIYSRILFGQPSNDWLATYMQYVVANGIEALRCQIILDRVDVVVDVNFRWLIGKDAPVEWKAPYQAYTLQHGVYVLREQIVADHGRRVIADTFREVIQRDISDDWLNAYVPYLCQHGLQVLRRQIIADHSPSPYTNRTPVIH